MFDVIYSVASKAVPNLREQLDGTVKPRNERVEWEPVTDVSQIDEMIAINEGGLV